MSNDVLTITDTESVIHSMLTENTGRNFLDSGDAYGRHWERNAGKTVEDFRNAPSAVYTGYQCWSVNLFQWLVARVDFNAELDAEFKAFQDETGTDRYDLEDMEEFAELRGGSNWRDGYIAGTYNSYNEENALSQDIQFAIFEDLETDETAVLLQIHGGADARGGYTRPRVFTIDVDTAYFFDFNNVTFYCNGPVVEPAPQDETLPFYVPTVEREQHFWDIRNGEVSDWQGDYVVGINIEDDEDRNPLCPECGNTMSVYANNSI